MPLPSIIKHPPPPNFPQSFYAPGRISVAKITMTKYDTSLSHQLYLNHISVVKPSPKKTLSQRGIYLTKTTSKS